MGVQFSIRSPLRPKVWRELFFAAGWYWESYHRTRCPLTPGWCVYVIGRWLGMFWLSTRRYCWYQSLWGRRGYLVTAGWMWKFWLTHWHSSGEGLLLSGSPVGFLPLVVVLGCLITALQGWKSRLPTLHLLAWMVVGPWYCLLHLARLECHYLKVFSLARLPLSWSFGRKSKLLFYFYLHICLFSLVFSGLCLFQLQI